MDKRKKKYVNYVKKNLAKARFSTRSHYYIRELKVTLC